MGIVESVASEITACYNDCGVDISNLCKSMCCKHACCACLTRGQCQSFYHHISSYY